MLADHSNSVEDERYFVNWVICGDGNTRHGLLFERGIVYANDILRIKSWDSFWPLAWDEDIFIGLPPEGCRFQATWRGENLSVMESTSLDVPRCPAHSSSDDDVRKHYEQHVCRWLGEHPGWVLKLSRNGARHSNSFQKDQYIEHWRVVTYCGVHDCAVAATIDAVHLVSGIDRALDAIRIAGNSPKRSNRFETVSALLDKLRADHPGFRLQKLGKDDEKLFWSSESQTSLHWLVNNCRGVFVVILESRGCIHTVAVDSRPLRRMIVDSSEPYGVSLSMRNLQICGGGTGTHIRAVRQVMFDE